MSVFRGTYINLLGFHDRARILGAFQHQNISPLCTPWSFSDGHGILLNSGSTWKRRCWTWTTSFQVPYGSTLIDLRVVVHLFWMLKVERRIIHQWTKDGLNLGCCFSWSQGCLGEGGGGFRCLARQLQLSFGNNSHLDPHDLRTPLKAIGSYKYPSI